MNERDESQDTGYGWKRDRRKDLGREKGGIARSASGESMVGEKEG